MDQGPLQGRVKWFSNRKGYGFIKTPDGMDYFVHYSDIINNEQKIKNVEEGEPVEFSIGKAADGRVKAVNVVSLKQQVPPEVIAKFYDELTKGGQDV